MRPIAQRYPLVTYYVLTLILSGLIFALLFAAGLIEGLFSWRPLDLVWPPFWSRC